MTMALEDIDSALDARLAANHRMQSELEEMEARILEFLKETDIALYPAVEDVTCKCVPEHFVPPAALPGHLKRCHGINSPDDLPPSSQFFYQQPPTNHTNRHPQSKRAENDPFTPAADPASNFLDVATDTTFADDDDAGATDVSNVEDDVTPSLVDPSANAVVPFESAVQALATNPHDLHTLCTSWTSIPAAFARLDASVLATSPHVGAWVSSWCQRELGSSSTAVDAALVDYILRLVGHPDYCHPDLMASELTEFLAARTAVFVVELWKVLVVAVAVHTGCFQTTPASDPDSLLQSLLAHRPTTSSAASRPKAPPLPPPSERHADTSKPLLADKKRKRAELPRKTASGRTTPTEVLREVIANRMVELAQSHGWSVEKDINEEDKPRRATPTDHDATRRRDAIMALTNPLDVRDWDRPGRKRRRSGSRDASSRRRDHPDKRRRQRSPSPPRHSTRRR